MSSKVTNARVFAQWLLDEYPELKVHSLEDSRPPNHIGGKAVDVSKIQNLDEYDQSRILKTAMKLGLRVGDELLGSSQTVPGSPSTGPHYHFDSVLPETHFTRGKDTGGAIQSKRSKEENIVNELFKKRMQELKNQPTDLDLDYVNKEYGSRAQEYLDIYDAIKKSKKDTKSIQKKIGVSDDGIFGDKTSDALIRDINKEGVGAQIKEQLIRGTSPEESNVLEEVRKQIEKQRIKGSSPEESNKEVLDRRVEEDLASSYLQLPIDTEIDPIQLDELTKIPEFNKGGIVDDKKRLEDLLRKASSQYGDLAEEGVPSFDPRSEFDIMDELHQDGFMKKADPNRAMKYRGQDTLKAGARGVDPEGIGKSYMEKAKAQGSDLLPEGLEFNEPDSMSRSEIRKAMTSKEAKPSRMASMADIQDVDPRRVVAPRHSGDVPKGMEKFPSSSDLELPEDSLNSQQRSQMPSRRDFDDVRMYDKKLQEKNIYEPERRKLNSRPFSKVQEEMMPSSKGVSSMDEMMPSRKAFGEAIGDVKRPKGVEDLLDNVKRLRPRGVDVSASKFSRPIGALGKIAGRGAKAIPFIGPLLGAGMAAYSDDSQAAIGELMGGSEAVGKGSDDVKAMEERYSNFNDTPQLTPEEERAALQFAPRTQLSSEQRRLLREKGYAEGGVVEEYGGMDMDTARNFDAIQGVVNAYRQFGAGLSPTKEFNAVKGVRAEEDRLAAKAAAKSKADSDKLKQRMDLYKTLQTFKEKKADRDLRKSQFGERLSLDKDKFQFNKDKLSTDDKFRRDQAKINEAYKRGMLSNDQARLALQRNAAEARQEQRQEDLGFKEAELDYKYDKMKSDKKAKKDKDSSKGLNLTKGEEALDKEFAKEYADYVSAGAGTQAKSDIKVLEDLEKEISQNPDMFSGALDTATEYLPFGGADYLRPAVNPRLENVKRRIEQVIQQNLRATLGAQFAEREGRQFLERGFNPKLSAEQNLGTLRNFIKVAKDRAATMDESSKYFEKHGTLKGIKSRSLQKEAPTNDKVTQAEQWLRNNPDHPQAENVRAKIEKMKGTK